MEKKIKIIATGLGALTTLIISGTFIWKNCHKKNTEKSKKCDETKESKKS